MNSFNNIFIFTGGESPDPDAARDFFKHFTKPDCIIAADSGLDSYKKYFSNGLVERKPDYLIGDFDSISDRTLLDDFPDAKREIHPHDKDWTDSELALMKAVQLKSPVGRVVLIGGNGGRPDHFLSLFDSFSKSFHCDVWLCGLQAVYMIEEHSTIKISNVVYDDRISISRIPCEYSGTVLENEGLEWASLNTSGMPSLSNRISKKYLEENKPITLHAKKGSFLVFVPFSAIVEY